MFEYAKGRFVNPAKIVSANIYRKADGGTDNEGKPTEIIRVAIKLDVNEATKSEVYSDPFANEVLAAAFVKSLPLN